MEVTLTFIVSYIAFQMAETAGLSGIVSSLTAGFVAKHFMFRNLEGEGAQQFSLHFFSLLAAISEALIFLLLGITSRSSTITSTSPSPVLPQTLNPDPWTLNPKP